MAAYPKQPSLMGHMPVCSECSFSPHTQICAHQKALLCVSPQTIKVLLNVQHCITHWYLALFPKALLSVAQNKYLLHFCNLTWAISYAAAVPSGCPRQGQLSCDTVADTGEWGGHTGTMLWNHSIPSPRHTLLSGQHKDTLISCSWQYYIYIIICLY